MTEPFNVLTTLGLQSGPRVLDPKLVSKAMERYARQYAAGAYAVPLPKDIEADPDCVRLNPPGEAVAVVKRLRTGSTRADFTGDKVRIPAGSLVATHVTGGDKHELPDLSDCTVVVAYRDDHHTIEQLRAQGFAIGRIQVSSASEMKALMTKRSADYQYPAYDAAALVELPMPDVELWEVIEEAQAAQGWADDFPYYSDGSWDALSLRGFWPDQPTNRVKPAEMGKSWHAANPGNEDRVCDWTVLADRMPATRALVESLEFPGLERVSLLRMRGGSGILRRHTDVSDKTIGTRDGQLMRFFIPLATDPVNTTAVWNLAGREVEQHLGFGQLWYLDARKPHAVYARSGQDRIHLSFDAVADEAAREAVAGGVDVAA